MKKSTKNNPATRCIPPELLADLQTALNYKKLRQINQGLAALAQLARSGNAQAYYLFFALHYFMNPSFFLILGPKLPNIEILFRQPEVFDNLFSEARKRIEAVGLDLLGRQFTLYHFTKYQQLLDQIHIQKILYRRFKHSAHTELSLTPVVPVLADTPSQLASQPAG